MSQTERYIWEGGNFIGTHVGTLEQFIAEGYSELTAATAPTTSQLTEIRRPGMTLSFPQTLTGLVAEGWITESEGEGWLDGTLPATVLAIVAALPSGEQFAAKALLKHLTEVRRDSSLVEALRIANGKTQEQIDDFFDTYAAI